MFYFHSSKIYGCTYFVYIYKIFTFQSSRYSIQMIFLRSNYYNTFFNLTQKYIFVSLEHIILGAYLFYVRKQGVFICRFNVCTYERTTYQLINTNLRVVIIMWTLFFLELATARSANLRFQHSVQLQWLFRKTNKGWFGGRLISWSGLQHEPAVTQISGQGRDIVRAVWFSWSTGRRYCAATSDVTADSKQQTATRWRHTHTFPHKNDE